MQIMSTNFTKMLVWKHEYDVNETPMKNFCVRLCQEFSTFLNMWTK